MPRCIVVNSGGRFDLPAPTRSPCMSLKAILLKLVSALIFAVMSALVRFLGEKYSVGQIVLLSLRLRHSPPSMIIMRLRNESRCERSGPQRPLGHVRTRGVSSILGMFCNFYRARAPADRGRDPQSSFASPLITSHLRHSCSRSACGFIDGRL